MATVPFVYALEAGPLVLPACSWIVISASRARGRVAVRSCVPLSHRASRRRTRPGRRALISTGQAAPCLPPAPGHRPGGRRGAKGWPPPCALPARNPRRAERSRRRRCLRSPPARPGNLGSPAATLDCDPVPVPPEAARCECECRAAGSARAWEVAARRAVGVGRGWSLRVGFAAPAGRVLNPAFLQTQSRARRSESSGLLDKDWETQARGSLNARQGDFRKALRDLENTVGMLDVTVNLGAASLGMLRSG